MQCCFQEYAICGESPIILKYTICIMYHITKIPHHITKNRVVDIKLGDQNDMFIFLRDDPPYNYKYMYRGNLSKRG